MRIYEILSFCRKNDILYFKHYYQNNLYFVAGNFIIRLPEQELELIPALPENLQEKIEKIFKAFNEKLEKLRETDFLLIGHRIFLRNDNTTIGIKNEILNWLQNEYYIDYFYNQEIDNVFVAKDNEIIAVIKPTLFNVFRIEQIRWVF